MINIYKSVSNKQYRTAYVIREDRTQYAFKYRLIDAQDYAKIQYIQGLRTQTEEFIIATTDQFDFSILSLSINIDDTRYKILASYKEMTPSSNGLFRQGEQVTYISVGK
jgi:hypothetical protein